MSQVYLDLTNKQTNKQTNIIFFLIFKWLIYDIIVDNNSRLITVYFTPTIENCGFASLIGLSIKKKLSNFISPKYNIDVLIKEPKNETDRNLNKQINDKERLEASNLNKNIVDFCSTATIDVDEYLEFLKS